MSGIPWSVIATVVGAAAVIIGGLIVLNLRSIKGCVRNIGQQATKAQNAVENLKTDQAACKIDCERTFVRSEVFLRETGFTRRSLETVTAAVNRVEGKLTIIDQLPKICGDISREIVKEMKNGESNG